MSDFNERAKMSKYVPPVRGKAFCPLSALSMHNLDIIFNNTVFKQ